MGENYTKYKILHLTSILCGLPGLRGTTRARQLLIERDDGKT